MSTAYDAVVESASLASWGASEVLLADLAERTASRRAASTSSDAQGGRVVRVDRTSVRVVTGSTSGPISGPTPGPRPDPTALVAPTSGSPALCVGDWVVVEHHGPETLAVVEQLPRTSVLVRAGGTSGSPQLLAANVDTVVIALALDQEVDASLLERFLAATWNSGAEPHVLVTKADLGDETSIAAVEAVARSSGPGVPITVASTRSGQGMDELGALFGPGRTGTLVGRSGAGKSSVINALVGSAELAVAEVRESDGKGRHTTSWRELVALPTGGALIDSPGIRSLALWLDTGGIDATFPDIVELSDQCRFSDCSHASEPDCAVREAIASGALEERRLMSYEKLLAEADVLVGRQRDRPDRR